MKTDNYNMHLGEKYCIICDRKNIEAIQKLLFSWGYKWNGQANLNVNQILPYNTFTTEKIYLSNYNNGYYGWVLNNKFVYDTEFEIDDDVIVYTDVVLLRKEKLKKLNQIR